MGMHSPRHVFVYGSLMSPEVLYRVVQNTYTLDQAIVRGFTRYALKGRLYPAAFASPNGLIRGRVVRNIDEIDLGFLDRFEGTEYRREVQPVECTGGLVEECWIYIGRPELKTSIAGGDWDFDYFLSEHLQDFLAAFPGFNP